MRTRILVALLCAVLSARAAASSWSDWDRFADRFLEPDGRVVDLTFDQKSTSEGQSYGLFFALVANDRARFDQILKWTSDNLADGKLGARLPAWHWGKRDNGSWGVIDDNAAADGELWMAYALLQASQLWHEPKYATLARELMAQIQKWEVVKVDGSHAWLLPGPVGFVIEHNRLRIDPSYLPQFVFAALAGADPDGPWDTIWKTYMEAAPKIYASGIAPDLFIVDAGGRVTADPDRGIGSYDAIRVYLWAGMSGRRGEPLLRSLGRFAELVRARGRPPEKVDPASGAIYGDFSPIGFSGAVLPYLQALGDTDALRKQQIRLKLSQLAATAGASTAYYDQALILFGKGWLDGAYRFDDDGRLVPRWASR
jgi:endoglucanase